ncbi:unnamed protein product, partial [Prorocentrum cordatum]
DYEPAWADVRSRMTSGASVDEAWKEVVRMTETALIDRCGLSEQGSKYRGSWTPAHQWISQWVFEARRAASLSTTHSRLDGLLSLRRLSSRLPPNADGDMADQQRLNMCKALAFIGSVFDSLGVPSAGCLAEIAGAIAKQYIEDAMKLARKRFGNGIDQQHALGGKGLHAFTREPMPWHPRPLAADAPDGEDEPPLPVPADQQTCVE